MPSQIEHPGPLVHIVLLDAAGINVVVSLVCSFVLSHNNIKTRVFLLFVTSQNQDKPQPVIVITDDADGDAESISSDMIDRL